MARSRSTRGGSEQRYEHPIPSREDITATMESAGRPLTLVSLAGQFGIKGEPHRKALEKRLRAMVRDGQLLRNRAKEYCLTHHLDLVTGQVQAHRDGFGFLTPDDGDEDIYIPSREMASLWDGDRVAVRVSESHRGKEGRVVEILERATEEVVGRLVRERGIDLVVAEGGARVNVLIPRDEMGGAKTGDMVRAEIVKHPTLRTDAIGKVIRVVGRFDDPGMETTIAILSHGVPHEWSPAVEAHAAGLPTHVPARAKRGREDLRKLPLVTIDGADAKDFDDAVYCEPQGGGWRLIVAIADVSHYVEPGTELDDEARARGTSVYFPDQVVPMLPEALSNGLCSLNPHVDRLCLCCDMSVSPTGEVTRSRFYEGLMRSAERFTYEETAELLDGKQLDGRKQQRKTQIENLREVYQAFARKRRRRGAIDFDRPETAIELDERGQVKDVHAVERLVTHRIIEECMIAANVEAAKRLRKARIPGLYRVHEGPDPEKTEELMLFLRTLGLKLSSPSNIQPRDLSRIIDRAAGGPEAELIETVILRSMKRAIYQPKNVGHFGLALPAYAHFTSPIRRYPDLLVHRAIKHVLRHGGAKGFRYRMPEMEQLGEHCSRAERRADEAVWEVEERLKCAFLKARIGEEFEVVVASITPFGLFVRLADLHIDGLVHVTSLPRDYYHREEGGTVLKGENTGNRYRLTDRLQVRLVNVDVEERKLDFVPVESDSGPSEGGGKKGTVRRPITKESEKTSSAKKSARGARSKYNRGGRRRG